jgi:anti-sigma regulatory factor (Ser/Thr protein kinase)
MIRRLHEILPNDPATLESLPPRLEAFMDEANVPLEVAMQIGLVLDELLVNTIGYGYRDGRTGTIALTIEVADEVAITLEDDGDPFDPLSVPPPDTEAALEDREPGGLGVHFVRSMMDSVRYDRFGDHNRLILKKAITGSGQGDED